MPSKLESAVHDQNLACFLFFDESIELVARLLST